MGVLTDIFIATEDEIAALDRGVFPYQVFPFVDIKGIEPVKLGTLQAILTDQPLYESGISGFEPMGASPDDEQWIIPMPDTTSSLLAQLDETRLRKIAAQWHATEEFQIEKWPLDAVVETLSDMSTLARRAQDENKRLFIWMSV